MKNAAPGHMRLPTRACAKLKSARSPKKRLAAAPVASRSTVPNGKLRKHVNVTKKSAASTTRKPSARLARSPRSASAWMRLHAGQEPGSHLKPMTRRHHGPDAEPVGRPLHHARH